MKSFLAGCAFAFVLGALGIVALVVWWSIDNRFDQQRGSIVATEVAGNRADSPSRTKTPRSFTSAYPTATNQPLTGSVRFGGSDCEGYNEWMAGSNDRTQRFNIIADLLMQAVQDEDFSELDLDAMIDEVDELIDEEENSDPPEQLIPYSEQAVDYYQRIRALLRAIEAEDDRAFDRAVDKLVEAEQTPRVDAKEACDI